MIRRLTPVLFLLSLSAVADDKPVKETDADRVKAFMDQWTRITGSMKAGDSKEFAYRGQTEDGTRVNAKIEVKVGKVEGGKPAFEKKVTIDDEKSLAAKGLPLGAIVASKEWTEPLQLVWDVKATLEKDVKEKIGDREITVWKLTTTTTAGDPLTNSIWISADDNLGAVRLTMEQGGHVTLDCALTVWKSAGK